MAPTTSVRVQFHVKCSLDHGQHVAVYGDVAALREGVVCHTTPAEYPWWTSEAVALPVGAHQATVLYRYGTHTGGHFDKWERSSAYRVVRAPTAASTSSSASVMAPALASAADPSAAETAPEITVHDVFGEVPLLGRLDALAAETAMDKSSHARPPPDSPRSPTSMDKTTSQVRTHEWGTTRGRSGSGGSAGGGDDGPEDHLPPPPHEALREQISMDDAVNPLQAGDGLVVVSLFLPVVVTRDAHGRWLVEYDYEHLLSQSTPLRVTRVGTVKFPGGIPPEEEEAVERALVPFHCKPIFLAQSLMRRFYSGFCKGVLWPVMHNLAGTYGSATIAARAAAASSGAAGGSDDEHRLWEAFATVNMKFRDAVIEAYNDGDLVWVHGFHLLLLPSQLTGKVATAKVGLFMHTPFPSSEIFRTISLRESLLRGMLAADHIGFHLFEYARHFLTCCRRILGVTYEPSPDGAGMLVNYNGRRLLVSSVHAGVHPLVLRNQVRLPEVAGTVATLADRYAGYTVLGGIDRIERLKALPLKLLAYERFLERRKPGAERDSVVMVQLGITASERGGDYDATRLEVVKLVQRINARFSPGRAAPRGGAALPPIVYEEHSEASAQMRHRLPLLSNTDIFLVTSVRDGLNRWPLEYVLAQEEKLRRAAEAEAEAEAEAAGQDERGGSGVDDGRPAGAAGPGAASAGALVLSEFSSCARVLSGAVVVNPWRIDDVVDSIELAMGMTAEERVTRHGRSMEFLHRNSTENWAWRILQDLKGIRKDDSALGFTSVGMGRHFRVIRMGMQFRPLCSTTVVRAYKTAKQRLVLLDYGGTILTEDQRHKSARHFSRRKSRSYSMDTSGSGAPRRRASSVSQQHPDGPSEAMLRNLRDLCSDKRNQVWVVSGRKRDDLMEALGDVKNLGIAAEHGAFYRRPGTEDAAAAEGGFYYSGPAEWEWKQLVMSSDLSWKHSARSIMDIYCERTVGTYIRESDSAITWHCADADTEFGAQQAHALQDGLATALAGFPVEILKGGAGGTKCPYIEVRPKGISKAAFAAHILASLQLAGRKPEFVLNIGDDATDEPMYRTINTWTDEVGDAAASFTCTVEKKPSLATSYLDSVGDVCDLLGCLAKLSTYTPKFYSAVDLRKVALTAAAGGASKAAAAAKASDEKAAFRRSVSSITLDAYMGTINDGEGSGSDEDDDGGVWF